LIFVKHELRSYTDKQEHWLFLQSDLMNDTKYIEAEYKMDVWDNASNGQKIHGWRLKYTFLPKNKGYGLQIKSLASKEIHAIFTLTKWLPYI